MLFREMPVVGLQLLTGGNHVRIDLRQRYGCVLRLRSSVHERDHAVGEDLIASVSGACDESSG